MKKRAKSLLRSLLATIFVMGSEVATPSSTDLATQPLVTSATTQVRPNIMFILDDSGSMNSDFLPEWANDKINGSNPGTFLTQNSDYNGMYYNPAVTYLPPKNYNADGTVNTTAYPSMTGVSTSTGGDSSATAASPNWKHVPQDGYQVQSTSFTDWSGGGYYFLIIPGEYCKEKKLVNCNAQTAANATYPYPAKLRWCNSTALTSCQAIWSGTYSYQRIASPTTATLSASGTVSTQVTSIKVGGVEILAAPTAFTTNSATLKGYIVAAINNGTTGYSARLTGGGQVMIYAPSNTTVTPVITSTSGGMSVTSTAFSTGSLFGTVAPGVNTYNVITSGRNSYVYPGTSAKASTRTDCAGTTCTYNEEMTNYANWYAYYRTRMQAMKTSASLAFSGLGDNYRVGYMTIDNGSSSTTGGDFLNIGTFDNTHKAAWYSIFFKATPSGFTPLRSTLSAAGLVYGNAVSTIWGVSVTDPVQYACQQNFTILSTDGYWNVDPSWPGPGCNTPSPATGCKLNRTTPVGQQDGSAPRPYYDGVNGYQKSTSQITMDQTQVSASTSQLLADITQWQTSSLQSQTSQLQQSTSNLQISTAQLQKATSTNSGSTWSSWTNVTSCTWDNSGSSRTKCQYLAYTTPTNTSSCTTLAKGTGTSGTWYGPATNCSYSAWSTPVGVSSCATIAKDPTSPYTVPTAVQCNTAVTSAYANVGSCNANATPDSSGYTTQCQYSAWTNTSGACTPTAQSTGPNYTVATACRQTDTGWVGAASCSPGTTGGQTVACNTVTTGPTPVASCTDAVAGSGNNYTQTTCATSTITPEAGVASCTPVAASSSNGYVATNCHTYTTGPTTVASCNAEAASAGNNYTATTCASSGGTANTLADVAYYYYDTSLRGGPKTGNCQNDPTWPCNVPSSGNDTANWQHMTTFTLGLGADGYMMFDPAYSSTASGDYYDVAKGSTADGSSVCTWQGAGTICGWPTPDGGPANIDDLWHAAVNGHGSYYSAGNPTQLARGLSNALAGVSARTGAAAAATTSNPNVTSGDNFVFSSTFSTTNNPVVYATSGWTGELERQRINVNTGAILPYDSSQGDWKAQALLDGLVSASGDTRTIYTYSSASSSGLKSFDWASLDATEKGYFNSPNISSLTQFCSSGTYTITGDATTYNCLDSTAQANAAGQNLVNFLRGQYQHEARPANASQYYRAREHVLGDIVSSESVYVKVPFYDYVDTGYSAYKSAQSTRQGMVYVAANDGMLHAFNSDTGQELWAYVPTMVLPSLYKLADMNYKNNHRFYVDGTPVVGDAYVNGAWTTLLVGGLGAGGAGFYALDVTTPGSPKALWEFKPKTTSCAATAAAAVGQTSDCDLGYGYGNPVITKLADGTWVVLVTSGYNNTSPGDAQGHLFVLDAATGTIINKLSTGVGSNSTTGSCTTAPCPSGLARITAWVDNPSANNTTLRVYGGDLFGYLYRFDVNGADPLANPPTTPARWTDVGAPGYDVLQLAHLVGPNSKSQPITAKPEIGSVNGTAMVYVGTGSYLGASDLVDANQQSPNKQSFYGIKDPLTATGWGDIRSSTIVQQTVTTSGSFRTGTNNPVDLTAKAGWYVDLPDSGERDNTDPALALGTIVFNTNVPNASACTIGGYSWQYALDYRSGAPVIIPVSGDGTAANKLGNALATRPVLVKLPNNTVVSLTKLSDTSTQVMNVPIGSGSMTVRRVNWRELITE